MGKSAEVSVRGKHGREAARCSCASMSLRRPSTTVFAVLLTTLNHPLLWQNCQLSILPRHEDQWHSCKGKEALPIRAGRRDRLPRSTRSSRRLSVFSAVIPGRLCDRILTRDSGGGFVCALSPAGRLDLEKRRTIGLMRFR
ncbi:uncharacterized protein PV09_05937 [Verruconis gallopava]|uniref:Uncharacterized protein n=1 Tax=Verruconis gallopava TaxID=253628 RepID=A0A0D1YQK8_9PEZI|nr:uncharacterized protein PV09_05937 [Verruconis gallopava]KIW02887.1 hypothetical protein PV09_05937 [Verruconis gallopava]